MTDTTQEPKKILVADDSVTIQRVVELTFSEGDYEVICTPDGTQAVRAIDQLRPDLVLLDVMMPGRDGYDVCRSIKSNPETAWLPVVLMAGSFEPYDEARAREVGANAHLRKPFESRALMTTVDRLLATHRRPGAPQASRSHPSKETPRQASRPREGAAPESRPAPAASRPDPGPARRPLEAPAAPQGESRETPRLEPIRKPAPGISGVSPRRSTPPPREPAPDTAGATRKPAAAPLPGRSGPDAPTTPAVNISREEIEALVRKTVSEMSESIVREVAWETIPDLAESIIKRRIEQLEKEAEADPS